MASSQESQGWPVARARLTFLAAGLAAAAFFAGAAAFLAAGFLAALVVDEAVFCGGKKGEHE